MAILPARHACVPRLAMMLALLLIPVASALAMPSATLSIYVSILPQKYLVERIGRPYVNVTTLVGPGQSPATFEPSPKQMTQLQDCRAYLRMGVPFENVWMHKIAQANPRMRIVNVNAIESGAGDATPDAGMANQHDHAHTDAMDPHTWTSPRLLQAIARNIKDVLSQLDPGHEPAYAANLQLLLQDLRNLDQQIRALLHDSKVTHFMVFHPAWGHFAANYGLTQIAIEHQGKEPGARSLVQLIDDARQLGLHRIFVQLQFNQRSVRIIAKAIGAEVVVVDPLAENVPDNLLHFARLLTGKDDV